MTVNKNVLRLTIAQALGGANSAVVYATAAIVGHMLSPKPELATMPISIFVIGMALSTLPVGTMIKRYGRRVAYLVGVVAGILMGLLAAAGIVLQSFSLFCVAMLFGGAYAANVLTFRFAATECVEKKLQPKALSTVLGGGIVAGVLGPELASLTMNLLPPHAYAVTYIASALLAALTAFVLVGIRFDYQKQASTQSTTATRSAREILKQPRFIVALICGATSYMLMNFMMTSAPLAMNLCGISPVHSNHGIGVHIIAMYAPSFFTGRLISRFGYAKIIYTGLALLGMAAMVGIAGMTVSHFWLALILLGMGWNFGFLGASAMVLQCHTPEEAPKVQAINDFFVFGTMVVGSFVSGGLLSTYGWTVISAMMLPPIFLAMAALFWLQSRRVQA